MRNKLNKYKFVGLILFTSVFIYFAIFAKSEVVFTKQASIDSTVTSKDQKIVEYPIKDGDTFSKIMSSFATSTEEVNSVLKASKDIYDLTKIKTGKLLKLVFAQSALASIEYVPTDHEVVVVKKEGVSFEASKSEIEYEIKNVTVEATIKESLFTDGSAAGLSDKTIIELADIFGWDIDFATDIREGDSFKLIYEQRTLNGEVVKPGNILAARFENNNKTYWAIGFEDNGSIKYYDLEGKSLAKQFLKSPLNYSYISTQYTNRRLNPVTKKMDTHKAIDYAAPAGTPVVASADGVITYADWKGGYGIDVEVKHDGSYATLNAHLSKIAKGIKKGVEVKQGDIIGYVGSTGISTGPHLHFAITKNNVAINPLNAEFPAGDAIRSELMTEFTTLRDRLKQSLQ